jgi:hypothetical protein
MKKIITLDIESAPRIATIWRPGMQYIGVDQLLQDNAILCAAVKERGKRAEYMSTAETNPKNLRDDYALVGWLYEKLKDADIVIAHNGVRFDLPVIRERMASHGYPAMRFPRCHDTFMMYSKVMQGASGKLSWLSQKFSTLPKSSHGRFHGNKLWDAYLEGNPAAWAEMRKYNIRDVDSTEQVWAALLPWWTAGRPPVREEVGCPVCGHEHHTHVGTIQPAAVRRYDLYECNSCGAFSRGSESV